MTIGIVPYDPARPARFALSVAALAPLSAYAEALAVYASLKRDLAERFGGDSFESRNAYAAAKTHFVEDAVRRALAEGLPRDL